MLEGLKDSYYVNLNRESGFGRYDIMAEPKDKNGDILRKSENKIDFIRTNNT